MISPYRSESVRFVSIDDNKTIPAFSFGVGSYSYDVRLSPTLKIFRRVPGEVVDPKKFNEECLVDAPLLEDENGRYFVIPANSYALGVTIETFKIPRNCTSLLIGKSSYARVGLILNCTPIESAFEGTVVLEYSNSSSADVRLYAEEGCGAMLFFEGDEEPITSYKERNGKYMHQGGDITMAKV